MTAKEDFLRKFNRAFVENDINFILDSVTDSISWKMMGERSIKGKEAVVEFLNQIEAPAALNLNLQSIIIDGNAAAVDGTMKITDKEGKVRNYGFCDMYELEESENIRIKSLRSYVVELVSQASSNQ